MFFRKKILVTMDIIDIYAGIFYNEKAIETEGFTPRKERFYYMNTICFYGLGLMGGSIAKAIRKSRPGLHILAYDPDRDSLAQALTENVIDGVLEEDDPRLFSCDYLFLAAPVEYNLAFLKKAVPLLSPGCIVTDIGSVKGNIHREAVSLGLSDRFIGGHPMAGSERSGYAASNERILENAYYIITPGEEIPPERLTEFTGLVTSTGAIPMVITAEEHDFITAGVSHLPHIIAYALVDLVRSLDNEQEYMKTIAAGGFRDITRIASSSPVMWQQICVENRDNLSSVLDDYIRLLIQIRSYIDNGDTRSLFDLFTSSRNYRDSIDVVDNGPLKKSHVLYVDIPDEAGAIATIATLLALDNISIKNIGIIHNREFEQGALKIEFYEEKALQSAKELLRRRNYTVFERE